jgi:3-oxoacyl-[acyl-carrier-protein] synthase II
MREVFVASVGILTSLGATLEDTWEKLLCGKTAIRPLSRFPTDGYKVSIAACIHHLHGQGQRSMICDLIARLCAAAADIPYDSTVIMATTKAGIDNLEKRKKGIPADISDIFPSALAAFVSRELHVSGPSFSMSAACASSTVAIGQGASLISSGIADSVFICCADIVTEFVFSGFSVLQALSPSPARPFDKNRSGLSLGEGAAYLHLVSPKRARSSGTRPRFAIAGWGAANDAFHLTSPAQDGSGLQEAIRSAMTRASVQPRDIAGISAHGTGTVYNDLMEIKAFRSIFSDRVPPVYSVKGAIGHTFGAAGGIEAAIATQVLLTRTLPPTVGFLDPENGAEGVVHSHPVPIDGSYLLVTNSGFGGVNGAILLKELHPQ